jgi:HlyD family secretion protein
VPILNRRRTEEEEGVADAEVSPMDRRVRSSRPSPRKIATIGLAALLAAVAVFAYVRYGLTRTFSVDLERVVVSTVTQGAFNNYVPVVGNVQPRDTVFLDAVDGGQVVEVLVEEGALVKAGQPLIRLSNANLQFQLINSEAQQAEQLNLLTSTTMSFEQAKLGHARELIDIQAQIEKSRLQLQRLEPLANDGVVKRADLEDARLELARLERYRTELERAAEVDARLQRQQIAQLDRAIRGLSANLDLARQNLENLSIKAPISGQLTSLDVHVGQTKLPGQRLGQIDQTESFKVVAQVDEHYLARVAAGQFATAQLDGIEQRLQVVKVYPEVRERQFKIDLTFSGAVPKSVRRGQSLQLRLEIGAQSQGLTVANGAFYEDTGGQWAFVVKDGSAERRAVRFGRRNPEQIEVLQGLTAGERIITSSYESLKQYDRVELRAD